MRRKFLLILLGFFGTGLFAINIRHLKPSEEEHGFIAGTIKDFHVVGRAQADHSWAVTADDPAGFVTIGPYHNSLQPGDKVAVFRLSLPPTKLPKSVPLVTVDIFSVPGEECLGERTLYGWDFPETEEPREFFLPFYVPRTKMKLEFRVRTLRPLALKHLETSILGFDKRSTRVYPPVDFPIHETGHAVDGSWQVGEGDVPDKLMFGGAVTEAIPRGQLSVTFRMAPSSFLKGFRADPTRKVLTLAVGARSNDQMAVREVLAKELLGANEVKVELPFFNSGVGGDAPQFSARWHGGMPVEILSVNVDFINN